MSVTVAQQIKCLIIEDLDFPTPPDLDETTPLFQGGLEMDSFAVVELITLIERHFDIEFQEADFRPEYFSDINALARLIEGYLSH
jgi:acyl carrier protein